MHVGILIFQCTWTKNSPLCASLLFLPEGQVDIFISGFTNVNQLPVFIIMSQHVFQTDGPFFTLLAGLPVKYFHPVMIFLLFTVNFYFNFKIFSTLTSDVKRENSGTMCNLIPGAGNRMLDSSVNYILVLLRSADCKEHTTAHCTFLIYSLRLNADGGSLYWGHTIGHS